MAPISVLNNETAHWNKVTYAVKECMNVLQVIIVLSIIKTVNKNYASFTLRGFWVAQFNTKIHLGFKSLIHW
jgi:hypothetical protein